MLLKIKDDIDLKELKKYGFAKHIIEEAKVDYYKFEDGFVIQIFKDRTINYKIPINVPFKKICIEDYIQDLIKDGLVEEVKE